MVSVESPYMTLGIQYGEISGRVLPCDQGRDDVSNVRVEFGEQLFY